ncbi:MAG: hypothetical protein DCC75_07300 [Proteobacteria bacterium]|nr:MAG: hypothetical protein DCC75_07300 [Pseudomonadota bacterium]
MLPFTALHKELGEPLLSFSAGQGEILSKRIQWFESEKVAGWDSVGKGEKLFLAAGFLPPSQLSEEQLSDLLMFPSAAVRRESQKLLTKKLGSKEYSHTLKFLGSEKNRLTRFQTVSLVAALRLKSENAMSFVSKWFESKPDPQAVFDLLIARSSLPRSDHFNLQAARYLSDKAWSATVEDLRTLSTHPEALARALAYSRLDPTDPQEKAILQGAAAKEPSERIRQELLRKLHSTANPAAALAGPTPLLQPSPTILLPDDMTQF